jgi:hypothetical protein
LVNFILLVKYRKYRKPTYIKFYKNTESELIAKAKYEQNWKSEFRFVVVLGLIVSVLTVSNYLYGLVQAPIVFLIYGSFILFVLSLMELGPIDAKYDEGKQEMLSLSSSPLFSKTIIKSFVILFLISGYWIFQIQKNESELKQEGYSVIAELSNLTHCEEYQSKCVAVDSFKSVTFEKVKNNETPGKVWQMCFSINYKYARYSDYYQSDYRFEEYCFTEIEFGYGWSEYDIEDEIRERLRQVSIW